MTLREFFTLDAVIVSQHPACASPGTTFATSQWQIFSSVLEVPGLAGRAFSYECILSPVGRSAQMPAAFLIPGLSAGSDVYRRSPQSRTSRVTLPGFRRWHQTDVPRHPEDVRPWVS